MSLRGVGLITTVTVFAELGDISRFDNVWQLMSFVGLVPGECSSGSKRHQTGITKTGNVHVRRVLVEAAWSYRFPASQNRGAAASCGTRFASCTGHHLEDAETAVQPLLTLKPRRQGKMQRDHGRSL